MSSKIFTAPLRTKGVFLRDEGGEDEAPVCRGEDTGKLPELREPFCFGFQNNELKGAEEKKIALLR